MNIILSNNNQKPIYEQITEQIIQMILIGKLSPGEALPSMRQLAKDLRISVITTKRAYNDLEQEGYIETITGKGSFIAQQSPELLREFNLHRIEEHLEAAIDIGKNMNLSLEELETILGILWKGE